MIRFGHNHENNNSSSRADNRWDMGGQQFRGNSAESQAEIQRNNAERQQRKIICAMALGQDGRVDMSPFDYHDVEVSPDARDSVLDMLSTGQLGEPQERQILMEIQGPLQQKGADNVFTSINSKHELRILGAATGGDNGFYNYADQGVDSLLDFARRFPTPMDFENYSNGFLDMIERNNGAQKRAEYETAMADLKRKVYGKKQEYWDQMKALHAEAERRSIDRFRAAPISDSRSISQYDNIDHFNDLKPQADNPWPNHIEQYMSDVEDNYEWLKHDAGMWQVSRAQTNEGFNRADLMEGLWADNKCEDSYLWRPDQNFYGVFDGAGGHGGGREASQTAAATVNEMANRYLLQSGSALAYVLNAANERICENAAAGYSTGVLAKEIDRNGRRMMAYAMVGDSRLYVVHKDGSVEQVTKDEGYENVITNALGNPVGPGEGRTRQFGEFDIHDGDRFVLCSDGITGDKGTDLMSNEELGRIVMSSRSAREASLNLVNNARKKDDRTAIVFGL